MNTAVFAIVYDPISQTVAATTRPEDKEVPFGLPGGKIEEGESVFGALKRECEEEGWAIEFTDINPIQFHEEVINNTIIKWFIVSKATILTEYKDFHRGIIPCYVDIHEMAKVGYGNQCLLSLLK